MDARRALPFLLLVICAISAASIIRNGRGSSNNFRRIRRLSEYLVPPPPPSPSGRHPRLAIPRPTNEPGYFARIMNWLNPFSSSSNTPSPPPLSPPPPPPYTETLYPSPTKLTPPSSKVHDNLPLATYDKPPPPSPSFNNHPGYAFSEKIKNCDSCNKVPWIPIQQTAPLHSGDASYAPPPPQLSSLNGDYPLTGNREVPYDAHHAASQQVRVPDFTFAPNGLDSPLPNPQLFPGAMPPLFKATIFNYTAQPISDYFDVPPAPIYKHVSTGNTSFPDTAGLSFNGGVSVYPDISNSHQGSNQELIYVNPGNREHFNAQNYSAHGDLSPSDTQVSQGHSGLVPDKQRFETTVTQSSLDSINHQTSFSNSDVLIDQNPPSSFGISGLDRIPGNLEHQYDDLSSSANVAKDSRAPLTDGSSGKIHFEESLLLDFTHKGESRTDSSSIPPTSNAFTDSTNTETAAEIFDVIFGTHHDVTTTETYLSTDHSRTTNFVTPSEQSKINNSATKDSNKNLHNFKTPQGQDVSYIPPSDQLGYLWSNVLSTTLRNTESKELRGTLNSELNPYDDVEEERLNENLNIKSNNTKQDSKRHKQVQLIIPYTSQYTPLPFHSSEQQKSNDYISEESRDSIKVTNLPNSSALVEATTKRSISTKVNNSIDVHKLQKNIDNWTIQEYSKGTTVSTESPSSANPYLFPSKQIPDEYLTTTEPVNQAAGSYDDNVKTFTLAGFSFNDLEYKGSASNRVEGPRVQVIENSRSTETDSHDASTKDDIWQEFSVDVSSRNKERVYVVTPQSIVTTPKPNSADKKKGKAVQEADRNSKILSTDTEQSKKKSNTFDSIEKAYQVLPQAVNNLAVASTGPESVSLWGIMEHEEFASHENEHENEHESEDNESLEIPVLYAGHSKVSRSHR